ncbi:PAS domain-containing protein [Sulfurimonas sp. HSL3-7]|uniref:PAS domain-containing protein n=1 Tax=Sulfonitrofixus jiaomeiensis TaxID=3131938 RepID=UPI0031F96E7D
MRRPQPTDNEIIFNGGYMITETDLKGCITYANRKFMEITGYSRAELLGSPHSIIRHPKMPRAAFQEMWDTLLRGEDWNGHVINLTKDGSFYWVHVFITPRCDEENRIIGYIAARQVPGEKSLKAAKKKYEMLLQREADVMENYRHDQAALYSSCTLS